MKYFDYLYLFGAGHVGQPRALCHPGSQSSRGMDVGSVELVKDKKDSHIVLHTVLGVNQM